MDYIIECLSFPFLFVNHRNKVILDLLTRIHVSIDIIPSISAFYSPDSSVLRQCLEKMNTFFFQRIFFGIRRCDAMR